jgi:hypothetical protein
MRVGGNTFFLLFSLASVIIFIKSMVEKKQSYYKIQKFQKNNVCTVGQRVAFSTTDNQAV